MYTVLPKIKDTFHSKHVQRQFLPKIEVNVPNVLLLLKTYLSKRTVISVNFTGRKKNLSLRADPLMEDGIVRWYLHPFEEKLIADRKCVDSHGKGNGPHLVIRSAHREMLQMIY